MNLKSISILLILFSIVFISGVYVSDYEVFPYSSIKYLKNNTVDNDNNHENSYLPNDVKSLIHVTSDSKIYEKRSELINFLWGTESLPKTQPTKIENHIVDMRYNDLENLESIHKLTIKMDKNFDSIAYLFNPTISNQNLIIYHQGHAGDFIAGKETIQYLLKNNFSVLALSMPLLGMNSQPEILHPQFGLIKLQSHNQLELIDDNDDFSVMKFFIEPVIVSINYLETEYNFESIHMVGISGGGWTAVLSSALDDRIEKTFSIAGSYPIFLRNDPKNFGDFEQHHFELYKIANYLDLYVMGSYGKDRILVQIFNKYDPCCFDGDAFLTYQKPIKNTVDTLGLGDFKILLDDTHKEHKISDYSLEKIINELKV